MQVLRPVARCLCITASRQARMTVSHVNSSRTVGFNAAAIVRFSSSSSSTVVSGSELTKPTRRMRVDNLLSQSGLCSRREARQFCRANEVMVLDADSSTTGERVMVGATLVDPRRLRVNGEEIDFAGIPLHIVMHKPRGYVCSHEEEGQKSVYELLPAEFLLRKPLLHSIGRLDKGTTGLLLFTQSGKFSDRLTNPRRRVAKEYLVSLRDPLSSNLVEVEAFASGALQLADGHVAAPALLAPHNSVTTVCKVTLYEGKYHQIRRMFAAVGHHVTALHRSAVAGLRLSALGLQPGEWRLLTPQEIDGMLAHSEKMQPQLEAEGKKGEGSAAGGNYRDEEEG